MKEQGRGSRTSRIIAFNDVAPFVEQACVAHLTTNGLGRETGAFDVATLGSQIADRQRPQAEDPGPIIELSGSQAPTADPTDHLPQSGLACGLTVAQLLNEAPTKA